MKDPIVEEIRKHRDNHAKKFNYDLNAICADFMERQKNSGHRLVRLKPRRLETKNSTPTSAL